MKQRRIISERHKRSYTSCYETRFLLRLIQGLSQLNFNTYIFIKVCWERADSYLLAIPLVSNIFYRPKGSFKSNSNSPDRKLFGQTTAIAALGQIYFPGAIQVQWLIYNTDKQTIIQKSFQWVGQLTNN